MKPEGKPIIESCFFACNKNSLFIKQLRDEYVKIMNFIDIEKYVESRRQMGVDFQKIIDPVYMLIQVAAQKVLQLDHYPLDSLLLKKVEDGPLKYLVDVKWNSEKALFLACTNKKYQTPILKMRDEETKIMEEQIDYQLSNEQCGWLN